MDALHTTELEDCHTVAEHAVKPNLAFCVAEIPCVPDIVIEAPPATGVLKLLTPVTLPLSYVTTESKVPTDSATVTT
jgi:hypothetical protein